METTSDGFLNRRLTIEQPAKGYRIAVDTLLLAAAVPAHAGEKALDLGCGVGGAMLALACRVPGLNTTGIDIQDELVELCQRNIVRNEFTDRMNAICGDITNENSILDITDSIPLPLWEGLGEGYIKEIDPSPAKAKDLPSSKSKLLQPLPQGERYNLFDHVFMNPPYHDEARHDVSDDNIKRTANTEKESDLPLWIDTAGRSLKPSGSLTLIHRADRLDEVLGLVGKHFGAIEILPIASKLDAPPKRVIVRAYKGKSAPPKQAKTLVLHRPDGGYTDEAESILRHVKPVEF